MRAVDKNKQIMRFRNGDVDKDSIGAFNDHVDGLFGRLALAWSQMYFVTARVKVYEGNAKKDSESFLLCFQRGNDSWGIFVLHSDDDGATPIASASNRHKAAAIREGLESLEIELKREMEKKRLQMIEMQDELEGIVARASEKLKGR